jgi:hypothetical protein
VAAALAGLFGSQDGALKMTPELPDTVTKKL